jgi:TolB-like protein
LEALAEIHPTARRRRLTLLVALLAAIAAAVPLVYLRYRVPTTAFSHTRSIAVLPLDNLSHDPQQEYFTDGLTEALITDLGKISTLRVISRTSVIRYKRAKKAVPEIARELGVDTLVEGACVKKASNRHAVRKMKVGPSKPPCRRRLQTAISCFGPKDRGGERYG